MKLYKLVLFIVFAFVFSACEKSEDAGNGNILVTVQYQNKAVDQPSVYLKRGTLSNPNIPLDQYDKMLSGDSKGQVYFENLPPDNYFIYAKGSVQGLSVYVEGTDSLTIIKRFRQNEYEVIIATQ